MTYDPAAASRATAAELARIDAAMLAEGYERLSVADWLKTCRPATFWKWTSVAGQDPGFERCDGITSGFAPYWSKRISLHRTREPAVAMASPTDPIYVRRPAHADPAQIQRHIDAARADAAAFAPSGLARVRLRDAEILGAMARECRTPSA